MQQDKKKESEAINFKAVIQTILAPFLDMSGETVVTFLANKRASQASVDIAAIVISLVILCRCSVVMSADRGTVGRDVGFFYRSSPYGRGGLRLTAGGSTGAVIDADRAPCLGPSSRPPPE